MRTTINLRDEALELARKVAEEAGESLGEVVSEAILVAYRERPSDAPRVPFELPTDGSGGLMPGVDLECVSALLD